MTNHDTARSAWLSVTLRILILILAGLLIFYHVSTLFDLWRGHGFSTDATYNAIQAGLRVIIAVSLTGVVLGKRPALWTMWIGIGGLVATHYWAHFGGIETDFVATRHPLSYLKGFIIPSIITAAFFVRARITS